MKKDESKPSLFRSIINNFTAKGRAENMADYLGRERDNFNLKMDDLQKKREEEYPEYKRIEEQQELIRQRARFKTKLLTVLKGEINATLIQKYKEYIDEDWQEFVDYNDVAKNRLKWMVIYSEVIKHPLENGELYSEHSRDEWKKCGKFVKKRELINQNILSTNGFNGGKTTTPRWMKKSETNG